MLKYHNIRKYLKSQLPNLDWESFYFWGAKEVTLLLINLSFYYTLGDSSEGKTIAENEL